MMKYICKLLSRFNAKPSVVTTYSQKKKKKKKKKIWFKNKSNIFTFPIKMTASYAEIGRVDNLETCFQEVLFVHFFL